MPVCHLTCSGLRKFLERIRTQPAKDGEKFLSTMKTISVFALSCLLNLPTLLYGFNSLTPKARSPTRRDGRSSSLTTHLKQCEQLATIPSSATLLFSSLGEEPKKKQPRNNKRRARILILTIQKSISNLVSAPGRMIVKFKSLSKKGKILMAMQTLIVILLFGSMGRSIYAKQNRIRNGVYSGPPIEVPYSKFLELVENSGANKKGVTSPTVDNMRISPERIVYRLTKESSDSADSSPSVKQLTCYTNKIAASTELIDTLHNNKVPFTAANRQRANNLAMAARTAILGFYMLILWRMYKSFSGNASGSGDTPGKVANKSALPLASFNDIQGIDDAKQEVMELVDTLRNPGKYAILGARAPTGLLLEGPPGKQYRMTE